MNKRAFSSGTMLLGCLFAGDLFAQACATFDGTDNGGGVYAGNTCGKNLGLTSICSGGDPTNGQGTSIFQVNIGTPDDRTLVVVSTTTGFSPELAFTGSPCSALTPCIVDITNNTQTAGPETTPILQSGNYFLFVSDLNPEAPGCGDFNLSISLFIPVRLQEFSVD